jgi:protein-tyrosine-phosphatase/DNA-binding transcriptional ArsR family regulator
MTASVPALSPPRFLQLLADEQRWRLIQELARSDRKVGELTELVGRPQNLVSYHLAGLRDAGIVSSRRSSADGRDTYYRLDLGACAGLLRQVGSALQPALRLDVVLPGPSEDRSVGRKPSVLFLCTGNSTRSQMAEALAERYSGGAIRARSAGSHPKPLHPNTVRVMAERGIDVAGRKSKHLDRFRHERFDRVITLCDKVREICPEFPGAASLAHWSMADPAAGVASDDASYPAFVRTVDELEARIPFLIGELMLKRGKRQ